MAKSAAELGAVDPRRRQQEVADELSRYKFGWHDPENYVFEPKKGLSREVIEEISFLKSEPEWMRDLRLRAYQAFQRRPMPHWGGDLSGIHFDDIYYFVRATEKQAATWDELPADIKATYDKLGIPEAEKQRLIAGVAAQYECVHQATRVFTANRGVVMIKEIEPGDTVFSVDEETGELRPAPVKAAAQTDVRQTYKVTVGGRHGRSIRATDNHPVLTLADARRPGGRRARYERRWKTVAELQVGDLVAVARDLPDFGVSHDLVRLDDTPARFPRTTSPDLMWLLGMWLGDGCSRNEPHSRTYRVEFAVPEEDGELRDELARVVRDLFALEVSAPDRWRVAVNSKALVRWLEANGILGTALTKRIPAWAYGLPRAERQTFLGGYVDADGYVSPDGDGNVVSVTSASRALLEEVSEFAAVCGLRPGGPYRFESRHPHDAGRTIVGFRLGLGGDVERLDVRNPRRIERLGRRRYRHSDSSARGTTFRTHLTDTIGFARVTVIEPDEVAPVWDIEVDGPHNFVAEGIVVHNSEVVYHKVREDLEQEGVIFLDTDAGLREHEDLFRQHYATVIPPNDNKFAALNTAVWSGGSFIWVPEGVKVDIPLQAYFRINKESMGQFERTLIIAEPGSYVHYVEGCLPAGELVATADGDWQPIESVRVGDVVLTHEGRPVRVKATQVRDHLGALYTFTPVSPANTFSVTAEHPLLVVPRAAVRSRRAARNGWQPEVDTERLLAAQPQWTPAEEVQEGDFLVYPKPRPTPAGTVLPLEFARLAGYYLADGSAGLTNGCKSLQFSLHIDDTESIEEIQRLCKELYDASGSVTLVEAKHEARVLVYTAAGYEALRHHVGVRSHTKRLSADLFAQDQTFLRQLVATYLRGDGNTTRRNGATWRRAHTTSRVWALQLQAIMARLGVYATVELGRRGGPATILGREVVRKDLYQVQWTEGGRGSREVRDAGDHFLVPVKRRVARDHDGKVFNLDVAAPDSYLASGFAVHNCTAPVYSKDSLHSAVVEIIVKPGARVRYTTIQNWSNNVYNLVTKRAAAYEDARMEWIDANIGSKLTMKYPSVWLMGRGAQGEVLSVAYAADGQHQDAGAKMVHHAPDTSSRIISKSISKGVGRTSYRGLVHIEGDAKRCKSNVQCDALLLDTNARSDTYPYMEIEADDARIEHEATVSKIGDDQMFYLMSRGLSEDEAKTMIVRGFVSDITAELPMEYAVELNRLIALEMEGAIG